MREKLKEIAGSCRDLSVKFCVAFSLIFIILAAGWFSAPQHIHDNQNHDFGNRLFQAQYFVALIMTILVLIAGGLLLWATFKLNLWLAIPYMFVHMMLILYCCAEFVHQIVINRANEYFNFNNSYEAFGFHMVYDGGSFQMFSTICLIGSLLYMFIPVTRFVKELRREKKLEEWREEHDGAVPERRARPPEEEETSRHARASGSNESLLAKKQSRRNSAGVVSPETLPQYSNEVLAREAKRMEEHRRHRDKRKSRGHDHDAE